MDAEGTSVSGVGFLFAPLSMARKELLFQQNERLGLRLYGPGSNPTSISTSLKRAL